MNQAMYEALQEQYQQTNKLLKEIAGYLKIMSDAQILSAEAVTIEIEPDTDAALTEVKSGRGRKSKTNGDLS